MIAAGWILALGVLARMLVSIWREFVKSMDEADREYREREGLAEL